MSHQSHGMPPLPPGAYPPPQQGSCQAGWCGTQPPTGNQYPPPPYTPHGPTPPCCTPLNPPFPPPPVHGGCHCGKTKKHKKHKKDKKEKCEKKKEKKLKKKKEKGDKSSSSSSSSSSSDSD